MHGQQNIKKKLNLHVLLIRRKKRTNPGNLAKSDTLLEIGEH